MAAEDGSGGVWWGPSLPPVSKPVLLSLLPQHAMLSTRQAKLVKRTLDIRAHPSRPLFSCQICAVVGIR